MWPTPPTPTTTAVVPGISELRQPLDGVVGGETCVGVRRDRGRLDAGGQRQERPLGHEHEVGEPAVDRQPGELVVHAQHVDAAPARHAETAAVRREQEHRVALCDRRHAVADLLDPARVLVAEHARQRHAGRLHEPLDGVQIRRADAGASDADEHVGRRAIARASVARRTRAADGSRA